MRNGIVLFAFALLLSACSTVHTGEISTDAEGNTYEKVHLTFIWTFEPACVGSCLDAQEDAGN